MQPHAPHSGSSTPLYLPLPPRHLAAPPPAYHRPVLISTYSHQPDRSIVHDDSSMAYYRPAPMGCGWSGMRAWRNIWMGFARG
jgi:hypothetical protein